MAFGPVLALHRDAYFAIGGHGSVRASIGEDVALTGVAARRECRSRAGAEEGLVSFRMYPAGLGQLVEGWSKNFATGATATPPVRLLGVIAWVTAALTAGGVGASGAWQLGTGDGSGAFGLAIYVAFGAQAWSSAGASARSAGRARSLSHC